VPIEAQSDLENDYKKMLESFKVFARKNNRKIKIIDCSHIFGNRASPYKEARTARKRKAMKESSSFEYATQPLILMQEMPVNMELSPPPIDHLFTEISDTDLVAYLNDFQLLNSNLPSPNSTYQPQATNTLPTFPSNNRYQFFSTLAPTDEQKNVACHEAQRNAGKEVR
jgi:heat shock protein HspQ